MVYVSPDLISPIDAPAASSGPLTSTAHTILTSTQLVNLALDVLDAPGVLNLDTPTSSFERKLKRNYPFYRDKLLRAYVWNFAKASTYLTRLSPDLTGDEPRKYRFAVPVDCLRPLRNDKYGSPISWELRGREILHDGDTLYLHYIKVVEPVAEFDVSFCYALSAQLALAFSEAVTGNAGKKEQARDMLAEALREARQLNAMENDTLNVNDDESSYSMLSDRFY